MASKLAAGEGRLDWLLGPGWRGEKDPVTLGSPFGAAPFGAGAELVARRRLGRQRR
jgi:hypothetical protein